VGTVLVKRVLDPLDRRMTGFAKNTVVKLLVEARAACTKYQDETLRK
jgi:hypothetical protein